MSDFASLGGDMHALATELFPINRSITGPGFRETLDRLEAVTGPMERHRFATGEQVFDWTIPREWEVREAWVKGPDGRVVASLDDSTLHLVGYSAPFSGRLSLEELAPHLHSLPEQPDAIPYRTSYYREDWGFCLEHRVRETLQPGEYEVLIDSELRPGHVEVGEVTVPGTSEREVLLSTYCCHPSMANNELSGPVVQAHLARLVASREREPFFTYRFVFIPETIGSIAYLARFGERLIRLLSAGYVVNCCGDPGRFTYKRSRRGDSLADRAAEHVLGHLGAPYEVIDFYPMTRSGSDERQYCSPGFNLPVGSLMRSMYGTYPEYHTSLDDLSFITPEALGETLRAHSLIVETLEAAAQTFTVTVPYCEPQLGPRGLYPNTGGPSFAEQRLHDLLHLISLCDGTRDLLGAAEVAQRPAWELAPVAELLVEHDLLRATPVAAAEPLEKALSG